MQSLRRAIASAGVGPSDIAAVVLAGGSSRIPLVTEMVSAELGRPVAVDAHPKHTVAMGARPPRRHGRRAGGNSPPVVVAAAAVAAAAVDSGG